MTEQSKRRDLIIGAIGAGAASAMLLIWIPGDIDTGMIDVWRRTTRIGDSMLPTVAATGLLLASLCVLVRAVAGAPLTPYHAMSSRFVLATAAILAISIALQVATGPVLVWAWFGDETTYRQLFDAAPWKYLGFLVGGTFMAFGFISLAEHSVRWRRLALAAAATIVIAMLYDLPFDTLLLPPNGDV